MDKFLKRKLLFFFIVGTFFVVFSITKKSENTNTLHISFEKPREIAEILKEKLGLKDEQKSWINIWDYKKEIIVVLFICACMVVFSSSAKPKINLYNTEIIKKTILPSVEEEDEETEQDFLENEHPTSKGRTSTKKKQEEQDDIDGLIVSLSNNAKLCLDQKSYDEALIIYNKLLSICIENFGKKSHQVGYANHNIAKVYHMANNTEMALRFYTEALEILESCFGENAKQVMNTLLNLSSIYEKMSDEENAEKYRSKFNISLGYNPYLNVKVMNEEFGPVDSFLLERLEKSCS